MSDPRKPVLAVKGQRAEELEAELLEFALAGHHERVAPMAIAARPPEFRNALAGTYDALAALALTATPVTPSPELRARVLESVSKRAMPSKTALLVIDMIRDHLETGKAMEVPRARAIVPALARRIEEARANHVPVVYVVDQHDPSDADLDAWGAHALEGTEGVEVWPDLAPQSGDRVITKPTYSAFVRSDLAEVLDELRVDTLVLTGCLTEVGVLATATDALQRGFAVEVPPDSQAGSSVQMEMVAMGLMNLMAPYGAARKERLEKLSSHAA